MKSLEHLCIPLGLAQKFKGYSSKTGSVLHTHLLRGVTRDPASMWNILFDCFHFRSNKQNASCGQFHISESQRPVEKQAYTGERNCVLDMDCTILCWSNRGNSCREQLQCLAFACCVRNDGRRDSSRVNFRGRCCHGLPCLWHQPQRPCARRCLSRLPRIQKSTQHFIKTYIFILKRENKGKKKIFK